jgi:hypothetical protein
MASLYKYMPSTYLQAFIEGNVLFRTLAYYQAYEADQVRGDRFEGAHVYKPKDGLSINNLTAREFQRFDMHFRTIVQTTEMFIFCASQLNSVKLAKDFKADVCIEIVRPDIFSAKIRSALNNRVLTRKFKLVQGAVIYREFDAPSGIGWALPDRIAMTKGYEYAYQSEYRFLFGRARLFDVENVRAELVSNGLEPPMAESHPTDYFLQLGDLSKICKIHFVP